MVILAQTLIAFPVLTLLPDLASAAPVAQTGALACTDPATSAATDLQNETTLPVDPSLAAQNIDTDPQLTAADIGDPLTTYLDKATVENSPNAPAIIANLSSSPYAKATNTGWTVCADQYNNFLQPFHINQQSNIYLNFLNILNTSNPRITFSNEQDKWALTGEPCTKYSSDNTCDETLSSNGDPIYYQDIYWKTSDGLHHWDAPKADARILQALVYLVTPTAEGGAGHEHITVGKIIQTSQKNSDFIDTSQSADSQSEQSQDISANYYDQDNPEHPTKLAQAVDITQIDSIRVTTRITQKKRIGRPNKSYQYKSFPINVDWQTNAGQQTDPLPAMSSLYTGSLQTVTGSFGQLLDSLDLSASVDPTKVNINSISSLTLFVGDNLLTTLLQGGSLKGFDLSSTLDTFGRSYLANQLGLPQNALLSGDTVQAVVQGIGQSIAEKNLGLPAGSLAGSTSDQIYQNMGARYYEDSIFKVSAGTLTSSPISNTDQLLQALGRGKIEQQYELKPGSLTGVSSNQQLLKMNYKTQSLFTPGNANLVDEDLLLAYADGPMAKKYNLSTSSFDNATSKLVANQLDLKTYELLVGSRVWDSSVGQLTQSVATTSTADALSQHSQACTFNGNTQNDGQPDASTCFSEVLGSSFVPSFLQKLGINLSGLTGNVKTLPAPTTVVQQALASPYAQTLTSGHVDSEKLNTLVTDSVNQIYSVFLTPYVLPTEASQALAAPTQLRNDAALKSLITGVLVPLKQNVGQGALNDSYRVDPNVQAAADFFTSESSLLDSDLNFWTSALTNQGQSGASAALDLPGSVPMFDANGIPTTGSPLLSQDPLTSLAQGNLSSLSAIGKLQLAKQLSSDKLAQYTIASQIKTDASASFGQTATDLKPIADVSKLISNGLQTDDFAKIFQKNLSAQVFQRVGQDALLGAAWNKSGGNKAASSVAGSLASGSSPAIQQAISGIGSAVSDISFYTSHWQQLQQVARQLAGQPGSGVTPALHDQIIGIAGNTPALTTDYSDQSSNLQTLINQMQQNTDTTRSLIAQAQNLINELVAGHDLSFTQSPSTSTTSQSASSCWSQQLLRTSLSNPSNSFSNITSGIASCQLENSLNLPSGSISNWYQSSRGTTPTLEGLEASVGKADLGQSNFPTYAQELARGKQVLEGRGASALISAVPGINSTLGKVGLNVQSIFDLLQGQSETLKIKLGGLTLDSKLQLPSGTMGNVANPQCTPGPCTKDSAADSRLKSLASAGMKQLGVALQLPASLDLTAKGDLATNYGASYMSENLALATNSFNGPFSQTLQKNDPATILNTFGLSGLLYTVNLQAISAAVASAGSGANSTQALAFAQAVTDLTSQISDNTDRIVAAMQDPASTINQNAPEAADLQTFIQTFAAGYASTLAAVISSSGNNSAISQIVTPYLTQLKSKPVDTIAEGERVWGNYQQQLRSLDTTYGLQPGTFSQYVQGKIDGSVIDSAVGTRQAGSKLSNDAISKLLDVNSNPLLSDVMQGLPGLTKSSTCPNGLSVGDLLLGTSSVSGCQRSSIAHLDLSQLFSGTDPNDKQARGFLYDNLLSRTFGASLENQMNLPVGTIRNLALNPTQAPEIALSTGLNLVADQVFQFDSKNSGFAGQAKQALKNAFIAGFYDVSTNTYSYDFNSQRATAPLNKTLEQMEQQELSGYSKQTIGNTISLSDLRAISSGDPNGLLYVGLQRFAMSTNQALAKQANGNPGASALMLNYADIRNAVDFGPATPQEYAAEYDTAAADQIRYAYLNGQIDCTANPGLCAQTAATIANPNDQNADQNLITTTYSTPALDDLSQAVNSAGTQATYTYDSTRHTTAQKKLQYQMYDIGAYELDHNIPAGFSRAMLSGNSADRANALSGYAFNALKLNDSSLGKALCSANPQGCTADFAGLTQFVASGFKDDSNVSQSAIDGLNGWATEQFKTTFGIDLPPGAMTGVLGWASTGFSSLQFSSAKVGGSGKFSNVAPIGTVLKNWGEEKLFAWGDKVLGFNAGGAYQIYQAGQSYIKATQAVRAAQGATQLAAAQSQQAAAGANVAAVIVNVVFSKQIGQAETQLGLVPGTGAMGVNILADLIAHSLFGGPAVSLLAIAVFIGMNLFGVYKTVVETSATADGYYPYKGSFGATGLADGDNITTNQAPSPDYQIGEFNPNDSASYHAGVMAAAQAKVQSVLADMLLFPTKWGAAQGIDPASLRVSQGFTLRNEDLQSLDYLISQPSPTNNPPGVGYGPLSERCSSDAISVGTTGGEYTCDPEKNTLNNRFGFFSSQLFSKNVHLRW